MNLHTSGKIRLEILDRDLALALMSSSLVANEYLSSADLSNGLLIETVPIETADSLLGNFGPLLGYLRPLIVIGVRIAALPSLACPR
jgi:hypothetical protein